MFTATVLLSILHFAVGSIVVSPDTIFAKQVTEPYVLKKTWVENFIKFQYILDGKEGQGKIVPLGCVPSNTDDGAMIKVGEQHTEHDFIFACEESEDGVLNYEAIACVDAFGQMMQIGEMRKLSNGTVILHCNLFGGALKKVVERAAGCYFNETVFGEDSQWIEPFPKKTDGKKSDANDVSQYMTGRVMECFRPHYSYYESHVIGCAIGFMGLRIDEYAQLREGGFVQCVATEQGGVTLVKVEPKEVQCEMKNVTRAHGETWMDEVRAGYFRCSFGNAIKTGCHLDGQNIPIGQELKIDNGCVFLCHPQANVYICDDKLGNFTIIEPVSTKEEGLMKKFKV